MLRFLWIASRGYRLRPWQSPYLRWRVETYSGIPAESLTAKSFLSFLWNEKTPMWQYLRWVAQRRHLLEE
jgi:hypothetical protein